MDVQISDSIVVMMMIWGECCAAGVYGEVGRALEKIRMVTFKLGGKALVRATQI